jgi:hypothetical protein
MTIVLVWVLMTSPVNSATAYSPPLARQEDCLHLAEYAPAVARPACVQIQMVVAK